jgi:hypothetical protein
MNRAGAGEPGAARRHGLSLGETRVGTQRWLRLLGEGGRAHCRHRFSEMRDNPSRAFDL